MFERQFGLRENPFVAGHQARFVYPSREHQEALAHLRYGIENREPFVLITGEVGTGKTTALYDVLGEWQTRVVVALITNSALTRDELLEEISLRFGVPALPGMSKPQILVQLERHLLAVRGRSERAILILDEAQNLSRDLLEEIRLLSNLEVQGEKLMQVFLVGQPELEVLLARPELRQLRQRIAVHYRLNPLSEADTERYIHHRLTVAGGHAITIFPSDACKEVYRLTHGIPREINTVAAQAMLNAFVQDAGIVMAEHVAAVARDTEFQSVVRGLAVPGEAATPEPEDEDDSAETRPDGSALPRTASPAAPQYGPPRLVPPPTRPEAGPPPLVPAAPPVDLPSMPVMSEHQPDGAVRAAGDTGAWDAWKAALSSMPSSDLGIEPIGEMDPVPIAPPKAAPVAAPPTAQSVTPPVAPEPTAAERAALQSVSRVREELLALSQSVPPRVTAPPTESARALDNARLDAMSDILPVAVPPTPPKPERVPVAPREPAPVTSSLPPSLRRKLEFEEEPEGAAPNVTRWLVIAAVIVAVVIAGVLASRFFGRRAPAPAATPVQSAAPSAPIATPPAPTVEPPAAAAVPPPTVSQKPAAAVEKKPAPVPQPAPAVAATKPSATPSQAKPGAATGVAATGVAATGVAATKPGVAPAKPKSAAPTQTTIPQSTLPAGAITAITVPVQKPAPIKAPIPARSWGVVVATFLYEDRAGQERDRLAVSAGLPGQVMPVIENGETSYRVVLGAFADRAAADQAASRLIEQGIADEARVISFAKKK